MNDETARKQALAANWDLLVVDEPTICCGQNNTLAQNIN